MVQGIHDLSTIRNAKRLEGGLLAVEGEGFGRHVPQHSVQMQINRRWLIWAGLGVLQDDLAVPTDSTNHLCQTKQMVSGLSHPNTILLAQVNNKFSLMSWEVGPTTDAQRDRCTEDVGSIFAELWHARAMWN